MWGSVRGGRRMRASPRAWQLAGLRGGTPWHTYVASGLMARAAPAPAAPPLPPVQALLSSEPTSCTLECGRYSGPAGGRGGRGKCVALSSAAPAGIPTAQPALPPLTPQDSAFASVAILTGLVVALLLSWRFDYRSRYKFLRQRASGRQGAPPALTRRQRLGWLWLLPFWTLEGVTLSLLMAYNLHAAGFSSISLVAAQALACLGAISYNHSVFVAE